MKVRVRSTWAYEEVYDYDIEDLPDGWGDMPMEEQAEWTYKHAGDAMQVQLEPLDEISLIDVDVIV